MTGVEVTPHPLALLKALARRSDPRSPCLDGRLTATYPTAWNEQLGREEIVNYPNQGERRTTASPSHACHRSTCCASHLSSLQRAEAMPLRPA